MSKSTVVYYSGYGHTKVIAETFANEIQANLVQVDQEGNISEADWDALDTSDAIVFGAPTYMGGYLGSLKSLPMLHLSVGLHEFGKIKFLQVLPTVQA